MRPTDFDRVYTLLWIYVIFFVLVIGATILESNFRISGVYFLTFYFITSSASLSIAYVELFALPPMSQHNSENDRWPTLDTSENVQANTVDNLHDNSREDATESTSLIDNEGHQSFARYGTGSHSPNETENSDHTGNEPGDHSASEQYWSNHFPDFPWVVEFLLLAPINIILIGQIGLFITLTLSQTLSDGSSPLLLYLFIAILSTLLLIPLSPFINRVTFPLPTLIFLLLVGTLCYSLLAFPFSRDARLKVRFGQHVDIDSGLNTVYITGLPNFIRPVIDTLPSALGKKLDCDSKPVTFRSYTGLATCGFSGLSPDVLRDRAKNSSSTEDLFKEWMTFSINRTQKSNEASIKVQGRNTRACRLYFDRPVKHVHVLNSRDESSELYPEVMEAALGPEMAYRADFGINQVRLWSREWDGSWDVSVNWASHTPRGDRRSDLTKLEGRVACLWSDVNDRGSIPAYDEAERFLPVWVGMTKMDDGLVMGSRRFSI